ncbi:hypothetical protein [Candidatus Mycolicibacterium alkanivorans]|uniref:Uncharacterized protein n=1 Tax=Candidatus Mycolicibacterium alkanivorans TaxID=2954114 RepID=A0ABS9YTE9_9MYCO|nr:hypothetical protein [Candidatus Mycolicibacterium alkanivorans]MCI4674515.1 hypothetical protein [Candidatus Mycolicibacterium alkanivorans]
MRSGRRAGIARDRPHGVGVGVTEPVVDVAALVLGGDREPSVLDERAGVDEEFERLRSGCINGVKDLPVSYR